MPEFTLDPIDVRKLVKKIHPDCREVATYGASVLSFMFGMQSKETLCRLNIYLGTGTVGCCKVMNDSVRECFRRNVTTKDALAKVLADPPKFALLDNQGGDANARDITAKIELAEVGVCVLMGEREKLQKHLKSLVEPATNVGGGKGRGGGRPEHNTNNDNDDDSTDQSDDDDDDDNTLAGLEFDYSLPEDILLQTDQCLEDIAAMDKQITGVSTNGKGCVFLYGNGGVAYTPGVPKPLYNKLKALKTNATATRPSYVAIGTRDRYYVSFLNGTYDWKGPKSLGQALKKVRSPPRSIAFGASYDTYFIVYYDGSWEYQGRSIPAELVGKLKDRAERPDLVCVTLGPKGEWFLRTENGRLWWGGIGDGLDELIQSLLDTDRYLNFVDFGEGNSHFVSYD